MPSRRPLPPTALGLSFAIAALAAQEPAPSAPVAAAWSAFQRDVGGPWLAQWNAATGTPRAIYGHGYELDGWRGDGIDEARRCAQRELQRWSELLGLGASDFRESIGARMGRTWTFTFEQSFHGVPVVGGRADVRIHMVGRVCHLGSTAWPVPADFDTTPRIGEAHAVAAAWLALGREPGTVPQPGHARAPRLVIDGDADAAAPAAFALAWEVPVSAVDAQGAGPIGRVYVDARTGAFRRFANDKHECGCAACAAAHEPATATARPVPATYTVMAWTHTAFSPVSTPTNTPLAGVQVFVPGVGNVFTDANGQFTADLAAPTPVTVSLRGEHASLVTGPNALTVQATLQPGVNATLQLGTSGSTEPELAHTTAYYWIDRVNRWARGILGNSPQLAIADHVFPTVNIASPCNAYYIGNSVNFYAASSGCNNAASASVVAHEWGHGLDDQYGGLSQVDGLSEGWGDICSMYLLDDPTIGHDFFTNGNSIRSGTNTHQFPWGIDPHDQGETWMGFAWKFRQNLRAALGTNAAVQISNDVVLASIAANAQNQPAAVIAAFEADDDDGLLGNGTPHYSYLQAACQAHSLPYPPIVAGYLTHTPLTATYAQALPRRIEVEAVPFSGSYTQVRVHWNGTQQRALIPTGAPNRWHGLLPGQLAPLTLQYHIEAQHSTGPVLRLPATGEYQYVTLAERRIWLEDFENGAPGWTHGATAGSDDWQIGVPVAHPGAPWSDPPAAASGLRCAGNSLGATNNGAYPPASDSWLRSPPIDCTGVVNVRLRFKRWASIAAPADRLELRAGGVFTWATSYTPIVDSGWAVYDTLLSTAANNPALVIEFRLVSSGGQQFGGWTIDDVEIFSVSYAVPLAASLALLPEQASQGTTMSLQLATNGAQPFLLALGDAPGPVAIPGLPSLQAGGNLFSLFGATDATGHWSTTFAAPPVPLTGQQYWSHVLTIDGNAVITSNPFLNLFTQ